jgi:hypothetical protein
MVIIELTEKEREALVVATESYVLNLRKEISDTESPDYRELLTVRKEILDHLLEYLDIEERSLVQGVR